MGFGYLGIKRSELLVQLCLHLFMNRTVVLNYIEVNPCLYVCMYWTCMCACTLLNWLLSVLLPELNWIGAWAESMCSWTKLNSLRACLVAVVNRSCIAYTSQPSLVEQKHALIRHLQVVWLPASSVPALGNTQVHFVWLVALAQRHMNMEFGCIRCTCCAYLVS